MSDIPSDLRYTKSHEWVRSGQNGALEVGITEHAASALGDLVFVEVPDVGRTLSAGEACAVVESVKAASDVYSPVAGKVTAGNSALSAQPELLSQEPYGGGWLFRMQPSAATDLSTLLDAGGYAAFLADEAR